MDSIVDAEFLGVLGSGNTIACLFEDITISFSKFTMQFFGKFDDSWISIDCHLIAYI